ncbi:spermidine synthase [Thalassotalea fusca]
MSRVIIILSIFIGAFLLFQVQPLIAKVILPRFGGGAAVWTASMLFFQAILFLGYLYAHLLTRWLPPVKQWITHTLLIVFSLYWLPIGVKTDTFYLIDGAPALSIFVTLFSAVGVPYFILSSTGPIVQRWLTYFHTQTLPYRLYSVSNIASLLALISFPFFVVPYLTSEQQQGTWTVGYGVFACLMLVLLFSFWRNKGEIISTAFTTEAQDSDKQPLPSSIIALWLVLSAIGVVLLVATTSAMTQNVPPVPFLWILPLSLYLLTFIICFHSSHWYVRWYWLSFFILGALLGILMHFIGSQFDIVSQVLIYSSILFSGCMICHGELTRIKPGAQHLTLFYLMMSLGGFLGSVIVTFVAPQIFDYFLEYPLALITVLLLIALSNTVKFGEQNAKQAWVSEVALCVGVLLAVGFSLLNQQYVKRDVFSARNFYGALSVKDVSVNGKTERRLIDGTTSHGTQYIDADEIHIPLSYYRAQTGGAIAFEALADNVTNAGFIGLGAGALAAYGKEGDSFYFYELNPAVLSAAQTYFSYLRESRAETQFTLGDGRVSLQRELDSAVKRNFDILVIDAFSGDSIPQHLITIEAVALYLEHLSEQGIIAFHISNTHLNLKPLIVGIAKALKLEAVYFKKSGDQTGEHDTEWMWLTNNKHALSHTSVIRFGERILPHEDGIVWTDDFSPLLSVLK